MQCNFQKRTGGRGGSRPFGSFPKKHFCTDGHPLVQILFFTADGGKFGFQAGKIRFFRLRYLRGKGKLCFYWRCLLFPGRDSVDKIGRCAAGKFGQSGFGIQFETNLSPASSLSLFEIQRQIQIQIQIQIQTQIQIQLQILIPICIWAYSALAEHSFKTLILSSQIGLQFLYLFAIITRYSDTKIRLPR